MTTYSRSDLATRLLKDLGLVGAEEVPSAADLVWASETIQGVVAQLAAEGISIWNGDDQAVPQEYLIALSKRVAIDVAPSFGLASPAESEAAKPMANATLRRMNAKQATGEVMRADYY